MKKLLLAAAITLSFSAAAIEQSCEMTLAASTPTARFIDNNDGTATDQATKLTWMRCSVGQNWDNQTKTCEGKPVTFFWQGALQAAEHARTNEANKLYHFAGKDNWRVPNIKELVSIREQRCVYPAMNQVIFPNVDAIAQAEGGYAYLWSSTPVIADQGIMYLDITAGGVLASSSVVDYARGVLLVADPK
ncbi:MAG: DUF1566 domain-containing protein [Gammaproteobacteria bacterium]|nr:DUF1566 domain-containing protein [Gammaproteobacteria bacterium]